MSLFAFMVRHGLPLLPESVIWAVAKRYVAGRTLDDALARMDALRARRFGTILDLLGEGVRDRGAAEAAFDEYARAVDALRGRDDGCTVSVKPTHLGLLVDPALCESLLDRLCELCAADGRRVRLEMEESPTVDGTLDVFLAVQRRRANLGCVLQARLFRTADDAARLLAETDALDVRLVKGIYLEPPEIAWTDDADIRRSFIELSAALLDGGAFVGFATHDDHLAAAATELLAERGHALGGPTYEFQTLMGVREDFAARLVEAGHRCRVYVPYGPDWRPYTQRRLEHNPDIARHVLRAMFSRSG